MLLCVRLAYARRPDVLETDEYSQCTGMRWSILAGIGLVESDHGATVDIAPDGATDPPLTGPRLDGSGVGGNTTPHYDTDDGRWDGDDEHDRAVGLTQHLPANWADYGLDATGSGEADPHNVFDSVASTAVELCQSAQGAKVDFSDRDDLEEALYRYNPADWYVEDVMAEIQGYDALALTEGADGDGSEAGQQAVEWALDQVGLPYLWGGNGEQDGGLDCSGLTQEAWSAAGVDIPRVTTDQYQIGTRVDLDDLAPGDLLFYDTSAEGGTGEPPTHVTIYAGDGQMVNAPRADDEFSLRLGNTEGTVHDVLQQARMNSRFKMLRSMTTLDGYEPVFRNGSGVRRLGHDEYERVAAAFAKYLETIPPEQRYSPLAYRIKDIVGKSGFGIGSAGLPTTSSSRAPSRRGRTTSCSP